MLLIRGRGGGTAFTGTVFKRGEQAPIYRGAPDENASYTWVCGEFYEVKSDSLETEVDGQAVHVTFDTLSPRGFDTREQTLSAAKEHVRAQSVWVGVPAGGVRVEAIRPKEEGMPEAEQPVPADRSADEGSPKNDASH